MANEIEVGSMVALTRSMEGFEKGQRCVVSEIMRGGYLYISIEGSDSATESFSVHNTDVELATTVS